MTDLEAGEIPALPFQNDGSFFEQFNAIQQKGWKAQASGESATSALPPPPAPPPDSAAQQPAGDRPQHLAEAAEAHSPLAVASETASASQQPSSSAQPGGIKPAIVIKPKQSIVQVRPRSGGVSKSGAAAKKKKEEKVASFYLQEMQRYQQLACDSTNDGARPMVK